MNYNPQYAISIIAKNKYVIKQIILSEITHIVNNTYSCEIFTTAEKFIHNKAKPLKEIEKELAPYGFVRINYNMLVNFRYIDFIETKTKLLTLVNAVELQVSARRWKSFKSAFIKL